MNSVMIGAVNGDQRDGNGHRNREEQLPIFPPHHMRPYQTRHPRDCVAQYRENQRLHDLPKLVRFRL